MDCQFQVSGYGHGETAQETSEVWESRDRRLHRSSQSVTQREVHEESEEPQQSVQGQFLGSLIIEHVG